MILAVIGSRNFSNYIKLEEILDEFIKNNNVEYLVSGGAKGADFLAGEYCKKHNLKIKNFITEKENYKKYGKYAPIMRNETIICNSDHVIAFWDGKSPGTKSALNFAKKHNKTFDIILF